MKTKIIESLKFTIISTIVYILIICMFEKGKLDIVDFIGMVIYAITMFLSNMFFIQKYKKEDK